MIEIKASFIEVKLVVVVVNTSETCKHWLLLIACVCVLVLADLIIIIIIMEACVCVINQKLPLMLAK